MLPHTNVPNRTRGTAAAKAASEDQHSNILETYLLVTRNIDPDRLHHLRKTVVRNGWTPGEATPFEGMAYTSIQELSTQAFYISVAKKADSVEDAMDLFKKKDKGGIGFGSGPKETDGIEVKIHEAQGALR